MQAPIMIYCRSGSDTWLPPNSVQVDLMRHRLMGLGLTLGREGVVRNTCDRGGGNRMLASMIRTGVRLTMATVNLRCVVPHDECCDLVRGITQNGGRVVTLTGDFDGESAATSRHLAVRVEDVTNEDMWTLMECISGRTRN